nr:MAG TPA: hypothetical protein [Bacteriophage sp.]
MTICHRNRNGRLCPSNVYHPLLSAMTIDNIL